MQKLSRQSPLFDITNRINEIIDNINDNKEIYQNFKPDIGESLAKSYKNEDIPTSYDVVVMGVYKLELKGENSRIAYELFINGKTNKGILDKNNKVATNIFMSKGDKIVFRDKTLVDEDFVTISFEMNILDAFIKEYESVQNNIGIVSKISEETKKEMEKINETIKNFYNTLDLEPVSQEELQSLLASIGG